MNVISYSLWGDKVLYLKGAIENVKLAKTIYPNWKCRFYVDRSVPYDIVNLLHNLGAEIFLVNKTISSWYGLFWRFFVNDDLAVERYIIRDCDSRLTTREANAVREWIELDVPFHIMKDHPYHAGVPLLGGMWGSKTGIIKNITKQIEEWTTNKNISTKGPDQQFLAECIWPIIKDQSLTHDEISPITHKNPNTVPFPTKRENYEFVGEMITEDNIPCYSDRTVIKQFLGE